MTTTRGGIAGLCVTALALAAVEILHRYVLQMTAPMTLVLFAIVYTSFVGGMSYGLAACGMLAAFVVVHFPGGLSDIAADDIVALAMVAVMGPAIVFTIARLQRRTARIVSEKATLEAKLAERDRIYADLEESRAEQRNIFNQVPAMIWFKDAEGHILRANRLAAQSIGKRLEQIIGKSTWELYPEQAEKYQADDREVIRSGRPKLGIIERYETPAGQDQWIRTDKIPYCDETGAAVGVIVFAVDITEQKAQQEILRQQQEQLENRIRERAEELKRLEDRLDQERSQRKQVEVALERGEERFRTIIDNTPAVVYLKDREGRYALTNQRFDEIFGFPPGWALGKTDRELFPSDLAEGYQRNDRKVLASGQAVEFEEHTQETDGAHTYISLKFPLRDPDGQVSWVGGISTDITDRKRAEENTIARLRYEEAVAAVSRTLLASASSGAPLQDALRELRHASDASRVYLFENFEDPRQGLSMRQTHEACAPGVVPQIGNELLRHLPYAGGFERWRQELSRSNPIQGLVETFPPEEQAVLDPQDILSILVLPVWSAGRWYGFVGFDETKSRRMWTPDDVRLLRTAAEMIGAYLARERGEAELRKAKDMAEAASESKTRFLANISHEIRTPIMAMLGAAELVRQTAAGLVHGEIILRNGRHLLALINELLDLARIEADKLTVKMADSSLIDIFRDVAAIAAPLQLGKPVEFAIRYATPIPAQIRTDRTRLAQAVINLVNNALKFTERGHVHVWVAVNRDGPEPRLSISVEDTGRGIAPGEVEEIFEVFTQVGPQTGSVSEGVGLGLPISRWIAEQLGGSLTVTSTPGKGSTFCMKVNTGSLDGIEWIAPEEVSARGGEGGGVREDAISNLKGSVLVAEDAPDARDLIETALTHAGATVTAVSDGRQAIEAHCRATKPFDLVLLDIRMPTMDGLAAATELRRLGCRAAMIAISATTESDRDRILQAGFDDVWAKPISLARVVSQAAAYLETREPGPAPAQVAGKRISERLSLAEAEFLRSLPARIESLRTAFDQGREQDAHDILHRLVGTAGICGQDAVSARAATMMAKLSGHGVAQAGPELLALEEISRQAVASNAGKMTAAPPS